MTARRGRNQPLSDDELAKVAIAFVAARDDPEANALVRWGGDGYVDDRRLCAHLAALAWALAEELGETRAPAVGAGDVLAEYALWLEEDTGPG